MDYEVVGGGNGGGGVMMMIVLLMMPTEIMLLSAHLHNKSTKAPQFHVQL